MPECRTLGSLEPTESTILTQQGGNQYSSRLSGRLYFQLYVHPQPHSREVPKPFLGSAPPPARVSWGCPNKVPELGALKQQKCIVSVVESAGSKPRCGRGCTLSRSSRGKSPFTDSASGVASTSWHPLARGCITPPPWPSSPCASSHCLPSVQISPLDKDVNHNGLT